MKRDWRKLLTEAREQGLCCADVAALHGCARSTVSHSSKRHGIKLRYGKRGGSPEKRDWPAVLTAAKEAGLSASEVARAEGVSHDTVTGALRRHSIELVKKPYRGGRPKGAGKHGSYARLHTDAFVEAAKGLESANAFCIRLGIGIDTLKRLERAHGIALPRRTPRAIGART